MWHEARKQERKIRGMLVDYRKRAERRQDFYERIRADPTQFIQIHGRKCKIHLDPSVAAAGDSPAIMMPWQGHQDIMIDRFDGRAHLDYIAQMAKTDEPEELTQEERQGNYERYRILAQNDFLGISEDKYLHQLYLEEQFGVNAQIEAEKAASKKKSGGVTIGYVYEETDPAPPTFSDTLQTVSSASGERGGESSDSELDMDVSIDVSKLDTAQAHEINEYGRNYGMKSNDFYSFLTKDADEADALRLAKEEEQEKIMFSGRKSRRERRAQRDKKLTRRPFSPPSYAAPEEKSALKEGSDKNNSDESRSPSPVNSGKITYITSFGGEDELQPHSKISINFNKNLKGGETLSKVEHSSTLGSLLETGRPMTYAEKVKQNLDKLKVMNNMPPAKPPATGQVEYVGKPVRYLRTNSVHRSRSRSRGRNRRYSRSRSRSKRRRWSSRRSRSSSRSSDRRNRSSRRGRRSRRSSSSSSSPSPRRKRRYSSSSSSSSTSSSSESPKRARSTSSSSSTSSTSPERRKSLPVVPVVRKLPSKSPAPAVPAPAPPEEKEKIVVKAEVTVQPPPEVPVKRYYGRKREDRSSSSSSDTELTDGGESKSGNDSSSTSRAATNSSNTIVGKTTASETKVSSCLSMKVNPRDRLKRKMQILLNKQFKADKKAEIERTERQMQQQQERDDEMRELALRLRRRQRELRHKYGTPSSSRSRSQSQSPARLDEEELYRPREKARSRSRRRSEDRVRHRRDRSRERSRDRRRSRNRSRGRSRDSRSRYRRSRSDSRGRKARRSRSRSRSRRSRRSDSRDRSHSQKSIKKLVDY